jgi:hypothetical protein
MLTEHDEKMHQMRAGDMPGEGAVLQAAAVQHVQFSQES